MTEKARIAWLFQRHTSEQASEAETAELFELIRNAGDQEVLKEAITDVYAAENAPIEEAAVDWDAMFARATGQPLPVKPAPAKLLRFPIAIRWVAAAVLIIISAVWWLMTDRKQTTVLPPVAGTEQQDMLPGKQGAILTLSDGRTIVLDSAASGLIAADGSTQVVKRTDGTIAYNAKSSDAKELLNTMRTPNGRQYQLTLPDGSKVWLNAASSITYPVAFNSNTRKIKLNGEAYFEVAADKQKPFMVEMPDQSVVQVLGTSFNINAYNNETGISTTLIAGSVKVSSRAKNSLVLKPGQQAVVLNGSETVTLDSKPDLSKILAWKNGLFNFEGAGVEEVMKQLERWYDVEVVYEGAIPQKEFIGEMNRQLPLSGVLKGLTGTGIKFRLEGRKLIVQQ